MSFFGGFVSGVFQGMDWREGRDERARLRKIRDERLEWDREDRAYTRGRRALEAEETERARRQRDEDLAAFERAFGGDPAPAAGASPQPMSILPPEGERRAIGDDARSIAQNAPAVPGGLGATGASTDPAAAAAATRRNSSGGKSNRTSERVPEGTGGARSLPPELREFGLLDYMSRQVGESPEVFHERLSPDDQRILSDMARRGSVRGPLVGVLPGDHMMPNHPGSANPSFREMTPEEEGRRFREAEAREAAEAARRAQLPLASQGGRVRQPMPAPVSRGPAPQDMQVVMPPNRATADATDPQGRFSPEERALMAAEAERQAAIRTARPPRMPERAEVQGPPTASQARAIGIRDTIPGALRRAGDAARGIGQRIVDDVRLTGAAITAGAVEPAGVAASFVGATDTGAAMFDTAAGARAQAQRLAAAGPVAVPQPGANPVAASGPATQAPQAASSAAAPAKVPGATTQAANPVAGAQQAAETAAQEVLPPERAQTVAQNPARATPREQEAIERRAASRLLEGRIGELERHFLRQGRLQEASAIRAWADQREVRDGLRHFVRGAMAAQAGDVDGFIEALTALYNNPRYYDDGLSIVRGQTQVTVDANGIMSGRITFRDENTGRTFEQPFEGPQQLVMAGALGLLAPERVIEMGLRAMQEGQRGEESGAVSDSLMGHAVRIATDRALAEGRTTPTEQEIATAASELRRVQSGQPGAASGIGAAANVPVFAD